jgi:broad specificity phosphatase PhoE
LVRHGESEGNKAAKEHLYEKFPALKKKLSVDYRLTERGKEQATKAGQWIKANFPELVSLETGCFVSDMLRTQETAFYMELIGVKWNLDDDIREQRSFGNPLGAESFDVVCLRVKNFLRRIGETHRDGQVLVITHHNTIKAFKKIIEQLTFKELDIWCHSKSNKINNTEIFWYSKVQPLSLPSLQLSWLLTITPWEEKEEKSEWKRITTVQRAMSRDDLLKSFSQVETLLLQ